MKTASQNAVITLTPSNTKKLKKACKLVNLTTEFLVNDLLSKITITICVKPKEYPL